MKDRDEWLRDIDARQHNVVFPDTAANDARFWRNVIEGKLTRMQRLGLALIVLVIAGVGYSVTTLWARNLADAMMNWVVAFGFLGMVLLLVRCGTRRKPRNR